MAKHETPMLDQLESGPWPSFVSDIKAEAESRAKNVNGIDYQIPQDCCDDLLGVVELSYKHGRTHWKHGGIVGVFGYGGGVIGRYCDQPECVKCKTHCSDCCNALFDLSLIEAMYINHHFRKRFQNKEIEALLERANRADRQVYKIKKKAYKDLEAGKKQDEILTQLAAERVRCAFLNDNDKCDLYEYRPVTCRLYGIPTSIGGEVHTCGMSGFAEGREYPAVKLDIIQERLYRISFELTSEIKSKYAKMAEVLVPLSMALLTDYDEEYLGIDGEEDSEKKENENE